MNAPESLPIDAMDADEPVLAPTWSQEAEQATLGGLLLDPDAWDRMGTLRGEAFFARAHRRIFAAIERLVAANRAVDPLTVADELGADLTDCGGLRYLSELSQSVPSAANIRRYAEIVRDRAARRTLLEAADRALTAAREAETVPAALEQIASLFGDLQRQAVRRVPRGLAAIANERLDYYADVEAGAVQPGWPTRIPKLDAALNGGLRAGSMVILAARPAVGKSSFALQIALAQAREGRPVLVLSQEMPDTEVADRAVAAVARIDYAALQTGRLTGDDWGRAADALHEMSGLPLHVDDQPALSLADIRAKCRLIPGLKVVVLDYLQLCAAAAGPRRRDLNRTAEVGEISRGLKALAKDLGVCVIALSQLNRDVEKRLDKRPNLSDLRDSGEIEQDADVVLFLWPVRELEPEGRRIVGCGIAKNRQGRRAEFGLDFFGATQRWGESTADITPEKPRGARDDL